MRRDALFRFVAAVLLHLLIVTGVPPTVRAILRAASTGEIGDGKIVVLPVEKVYRIGTREQDEAAVTRVG